MSIFCALRSIGQFELLNGAFSAWVKYFPFEFDADILPKRCVNSTRYFDILLLLFKNLSGLFSASLRRLNVSASKHLEKNQMHRHLTQGVQAKPA